MFWGGVRGGDLNLFDLVLVLIGDLLGLVWEEKKLVIFGRLYFLGVSFIYLVAVLAGLCLWWI